MVQASVGTEPPQGGKSPLRGRAPVGVVCWFPNWLVGRHLAGRTRRCAWNCPPGGQKRTHRQMPGVRAPRGMRIATPRGRARAERCSTANSHVTCGKVWASEPPSAAGPPRGRWPSLRARRETGADRSQVGLPNRVQLWGRSSGHRTPYGIRDTLSSDPHPYEGPALGQPRGADRRVASRPRYPCNETQRGQEGMGAWPRSST